MQIAASVESLQGMTDNLHGRGESKSAPLQTKGCGTQAQYLLGSLAE